MQDMTMEFAGLFVVPPVVKSTLGAAFGWAGAKIGGLFGRTAFTAPELAIINEARGIMGSTELASLRAAHAAGEPLAVTINGRLVQYEPGLSASGMTMFGENGFVLGSQAFRSATEVQQTVLQELYRLTMSQSAAGVTQALATAETNAAAGFAARAVGQLVK